MLIIAMALTCADSGARIWGLPRRSGHRESITSGSWTATQGESHIWVLHPGSATSGPQLQAVRLSVGNEAQVLSRVQWDQLLYRVPHGLYHSLLQLQPLLPPWHRWNTDGCQQASYELSQHSHTWLNSYSSCSLPYRRSVASSKMTSPESAILCFLFLFPVSSHFLKAAFPKSCWSRNIF